MNYANISDLFITLTSSIRQVMKQIDQSGKIGIALIVNQDRQIINTITDGDVRRGILAGLSLDRPVSELLSIKAHLPRAVPLTAAADTEPVVLLQLMRENGVRQIPLLNGENQVVDIVCLGDLIPSPTAPLHAVVMAGGQGLRMRPLTDNVPKPMLSIGDRPLMELTLEKLYNSGVRRVDVSTNYLAQNIIDHFGDGSTFGIELNYLREDRPLGTAGALGLMNPPEGTILVINGDILTEVDFAAMLNYHQEQNSDLTVGVRQYGIQVPYGVVECEGPKVRHLTEKPHLTVFVNAGIYLLEPSVYRYIPKDRRCDMTDLIQTLLHEDRPVMSFPIIEYWLDIGQPADYEQAQNDAKSGRYSSTAKSDPVQVAQ
jgi:dTDP-glucose pyrophosphorylase/CBS domain-containing protein